MTFLSFRSNPWRYLMLAGAFHIALTIVIFLLGHFQILPGTFDQNGIGLTFAIDGTSYQRVATGLVDEWQGKGFTAWLNARAPFHSRLLSLSFATFGRLLGHNILAAEPLNLFYYLGILVCIYILGREIFSPRTGLLAASIVAVWPSFLLHSTQLIRDSLAILCFLALMVVLTLLLTREFRWQKGIGLGIGGAILVTVFWVTRGNMWNVVLVAIVIAVVLLVQQTIRQKRLMTGNAIVILLLVLATLLIPTRLESSTLPGIRPPATPLAIPSTSQPGPSEGIWTRAIKQIADRRGGFRFFTSQASNIDADVRFQSFGDMVRFLPRATVIGFFAPFPKMWIQLGSFGHAGRLLSGLETLAMYFLYVAVAFCVWRERRNLRLWLLFLVGSIGIVALGLVVVNAGALYRIRYVFWMMLIVIAAEGILNLRYLTVFRTTLTKS
jgi:4-amino-4-deoxy-L-arabinose transferase-like glycosyltransferase